MAGWILVTLLAADSSAFQLPTLGHVRSDEALIRHALGEGYARSATFAQILDRVEGLPCVVYVATSVSLPRPLDGALLHVSAGRADMPVLRVALRTNLSQDETIAILGHELQHVIEVMSSTPASGGTWMTQAFDRLDPESRGAHRSETARAREVQEQVRQELRRPQRPVR